MSSKFSAIAGMLLFGTSTVVLQKFLFSMRATGDPTLPGNREFKKPWFQTVVMFVGMLGCLAVYEVQRWMSRRKTSHLSVQEDPKGGATASHKKIYIYVLVPAMFDLIATGMMNIGLLSTPASVWQMMRGSMVIFSSIFSVVFLKRKLYGYNWFGVFVCIVALLVVGVAAILSDNEHASKHKKNPGDVPSSTEVIVGMILVILAQIVQSSQIVVEDFLLHDVKASPLFIVGLEGLWGTIVGCAVILPIFGAVPGIEGKGIHESTIDTFEMLGNDNVLIIVIVVYALAILGYNGFGMAVTSHFTAVHRTILEAMRTAFIWIAQVIIYYSIGDPDTEIGEEWNRWSYLQLFGFGLLLIGMLIYNKIFILKKIGFYYPPEGEMQRLTETKDDGVYQVLEDEDV